MILLNTKDISVNDKTSVVLGNFDGVHLAHQRLFDIAKKRADQMLLKSIAFTFNPHPQLFFGSSKFKSITTSSEKRMLLELLGIDYCIEYPFDEELTKTEPKKFFKEVLIDKLNAKVLTVGESHRFGKDRQGSGEILSEMCNKYDVELNIVDDMISDGEVISSTAIRQYIDENQLKRAKEMLGRPYFIAGKVEEGNKLGRTIDCPTINFMKHDAKLYPSFGVYVTETIVRGRNYKSATNIGSNPTVGGTGINIETHLLDFSEDIYGEMAVVFFYERIRSEIKFDTMQAMSDEIAADIQYTYDFFDKLGGNS